MTIKKILGVLRFIGLFAFPLHILADSEPIKELRRDFADFIKALSPQKKTVPNQETETAEENFDPLDEEKFIALQNIIVAKLERLSPQAAGTVIKDWANELVVAFKDLKKAELAIPATTEQMYRDLVTDIYNKDQAVVNSAETLRQYYLQHNKGVDIEDIEKIVPGYFEIQENFHSKINKATQSLMQTDAFKKAAIVDEQGAHFFRYLHQFLALGARLTNSSLSNVFKPCFSWKSCTHNGMQCISNICFFLRMSVEKLYKYGRDNTCVCQPKKPACSWLHKIKLFLLFC